MEVAQLAEQLEALLKRLGLQVRYEPFDAKVFADLSSRGGLCTLHGEQVVVVDSRAPLTDRVVVLALVASRFDLEALYLAPRVRQAIDACAEGRPGTVLRGSEPRLRLVVDDGSDSNEK